MLRFQNVVLEDPNDLVGWNNLALALVEQNDPAKKRRALTYAKDNYRKKNNNPDALWTLGWVYYRCGDFALAGLAIELAANATNDQVTNADSATYLAHILYQQGKKWRTKEISGNVLKDDRPFFMRPEALKLYEKVKDAKDPETALTPSPNPLLPTMTMGTRCPTWCPTASGRGE